MLLVRTVVLSGGLSNVKSYELEAEQIVTMRNVKDLEQVKGKGGNIMTKWGNYVKRLCCMEWGNMNDNMNVYNCLDDGVPLGASKKPKYSGEGLVQAAAIEGRVRSRETARDLAKVANFGLAARTKETYQTTINHIGRCQEETGADMSLPFTLDKTLEFIGWMRARGLKGSTMSTYLSGVRMYHIATGQNEPGLREPIVKLILKGQGNMDKLRKWLLGKVGRLPVTIKMMKLLKLKLGKVDWPMAVVRLFWAVACLAWAGSFRIHELLSRTKTEVDTQITLLWEDVRFGTVKTEGQTLKTMSVHVKSPKVDRVGQGDRIMVVQLDGPSKFMCPIAAMEKYRSSSQLREGASKPVFRLPEGLCFTGKDMNLKLGQLTSSLAQYLPGGEVTSHSFRAGVARWVGISQLN